MLPINKANIKSPVILNLEGILSGGHSESIRADLVIENHAFQVIKAMGPMERKEYNVIAIHFLEMARDLNKEEEYFKRLYKYLVPYRDKFLPVNKDIYAQFLLKAYTAETFLYKEMNKAYRRLDPASLFMFRDIYHYTFFLLSQKTAPFYSGTLYRGTYLSE